MISRGQRFLVVLALASALLECRSGVRTPGPLGVGCGEFASGPLLYFTRNHHLEPGGQIAVFTLRIDGASLADGMATLCVESDSALLYRNVWRTWWWWHGPTAPMAAKGDSVVRTVAARFFDERAFGTLETVESMSSWVNNPSFDRRAAIAEGLKERDYWTAHRLILGTPLSASVRDSLRSAPVDSGFVIALADSLGREYPTSFAYWLGEENGLLIAWWNRGRQFVTIERPS